jgi:hypothetical protein
MTPATRTTALFVPRTQAEELAQAEYVLNARIVLRLWFGQYDDIARYVLTELRMPADQQADYLATVDAVARCLETIIVERIQWGFPGYALFNVTYGADAMEMSKGSWDEVALARSVATQLDRYLQDKLRRAGATLHLRQAIIALCQFALSNGMMPAELSLDTAWHSSAIGAMTTKADFLQLNEGLTGDLLQVPWVHLSQVPAADIDRHVTHRLRALAANIW